MNNNEQPLSAWSFMKYVTSLAGIPALGIFVIVCLMASQAKAADASACYVIASADHRAFCLAKARGESSMCYAIGDAGLRAECLAEVRK
jgi:hypothetical protein